MKSKKLILIRHGELAARWQEHFIGHTNPPLSRSGRADCARLKPIWNHLGGGAVYASPLMRAKQSAGIICPDTTIRYDDRLKEMSFGDWENLTFKQIEQIEPDIGERWAKNQQIFQFPGGESFQEFTTRCEDVLNELLENQEEQLTIVTHGGVLIRFFRKLLKLPEDNIWRWQPQRGSLSIVQVDLENHYTKLQLYNLKPGDYFNV